MVREGRLITRALRRRSAMPKGRVHVLPSTHSTETQNRLAMGHFDGITWLVHSSSIPVSFAGTDS